MQKAKPSTEARHASPKRGVPGDTPHVSSSRSDGSRLRIRRAYEPREPDDGRRVLVDRLWPRGLSKQDLEDVLWIRDVAPSTSLRKWFGHKPERWAEFRRRYFAELRVNPSVKILRDIIAAGPVTLIYGAHDETHNQAVALAEYLGQGPAPLEEGR
jgi:uncharacterized protein YeaO (DUF488 family)